METRVHYRLLLYSWAFFLPNVWIVFAFAYQAVAPNHALNAPLLYLVSFFTPLQVFVDCVSNTIGSTLTRCCLFQGLMNAIVYGVNRTVGISNARYQSLHRR